MNFLKLILIIFISILLNKNCLTQPQTEWIQRYNSPGNYDDYLTDMAIDKSGNVYLTGYVSVNDTNQNYVTIKYNSNGIEEWVRYYDGPDAGSSYSSSSSYVISLLNIIQAEIHFGIEDIVME